MAPPKVVITRKIPQSALNIIQEKCDILHWDKDEVIPRETLLEWLSSGEIQGIYCLLTDKINEELLSIWEEANMKKGIPVKVVSTMSVGFDHVDVPACRKRGIAVGNTPGVLTDTTADLAVALLLCTARRLVEGNQAILRNKWGTWTPLWMVGVDVHEKKVAVIGLGRIGFAVAQRLIGFGCDILYSDTERKQGLEDKLNILIDAHNSINNTAMAHVKYCSFREAISIADFVTVHVQLDSSTAGLFGKEEFSIMKNSAMFINTSRGGICDQSALISALRSPDGISAAGLDVVTPEPIDGSHELMSLPNCTVLPHIGSGSIETRTKMADLAANNLVNGVYGESLVNNV